MHSSTWGPVEATSYGVVDAVWELMEALWGSYML